MNDLNDFEKAKKLFQQGLNNFQKENYKKAEADFIESLNLAPDRLTTLHNLILYISGDAWSLMCLNHF